MYFKKGVELSVIMPMYSRNRQWTRRRPWWSSSWLQRRWRGRQWTRRSWWAGPRLPGRPCRCPKRQFDYISGFVSNSANTLIQEGCGVISNSANTLIQEGCGVVSISANTLIQEGCGGCGFVSNYANTLIQEGVKGVQLSVILQMYSQRSSWCRARRCRRMPGRRRHARQSLHGPVPREADLGARPHCDPASLARLARPVAGRPG